MQLCLNTEAVRKRSHFPSFLSTTMTSTYPPLSPPEHARLCVAFFGLSLLKNGRDGDEIGGQRLKKRVKTASASNVKVRIPHSSLMNRLRLDRTRIRRSPHHPMDVDTPAKRARSDDDDAEPPSSKRAKPTSPSSAAPMFLCQCPLVSEWHQVVVTFRDVTVVVNPYDDLSPSRKAAWDGWNARCTDGHLSQHAPSAFSTPSTSSTAIPKSEKAKGKQRAVEPFGDVTNAQGRVSSGGMGFIAGGSENGSSGGGRKVEQKKSRRNAPYASSSWGRPSRA
ncbi:hypothetical protein B0H16DRAFT_1609544 [Mycena metata]|uniref:Uncharacterized protein n=1 Tax=Mycena metata TaxID=1033252 RepID=A0AAD7HDG9_9AGAR|nr:hypothetical protein B0H16DRAFT_1609544 [Mycena metata]